MRAAGTTEMPVRSPVSCDQAAQTWNESGTPPAGVHRLSNPSRPASCAASRSWPNGRARRASRPTPIIMTGSMPDGAGSAEVPGQEFAVDPGPADGAMIAWVRVQRLLGGGEGVEQRERGL